MTATARTMVPPIIPATITTVDSSKTCLRLSVSRLDLWTGVKYTVISHEKGCSNLVDCNSYYPHRDHIRTLARTHTHTQKDKRRGVTCRGSAVSSFTSPGCSCACQTPFFIASLAANHRFISISLVPRMRWGYRIGTATHLRERNEYKVLLLFL